METRALLVSTACAASLAIGALDAVLALASEPHGAASLRSLLLPATLVVGAALLLITPTLWVVLRRAPGELRPALAISLGVGAVVLFGLLWVAELNRFSMWTGEPLAALFRVVPVAAAAALTAVGAYATARSRGFDPARVARIMAALALLVSIVLGIQSVLWLVPAFDGTTSLAVSAAMVLLGGAGLFLVARASIAWLAGPMALAVVALLVAGAVEPLPRSAPQTEFPGGEPTLARIVLITVDTLRDDAIAGPRGEGAATPNIGSLAAEGLRFTNAFSPAPWTIPAFVSLMTGVSADLHRVNHDFAEIPESLETLAEVLSAAGYRTAGIGHHPQLLRMGRGFQHFDFTPVRLPYHEKMTGGRVLRRLLERNYGTDDIPEAVDHWLASNGSEPFLLWVHFLDPHFPYTAPARFLPDDPLIDRLGADSGDIRSSEVRMGRRVRGADEQRWMRLLYDAEVRWVDDAIGRVLRSLEEYQLYDDALIILVSDHGEEFWEHGAWEHGHSLYDEVVRVPFIVRLPGAEKRGVIETPVSTSAIGETIAELAGVEAFSGQESSASLVPLWTDEAASRNPLYLTGTEYFERLEGVVFDGLKYVQSTTSDAEELYDLVADPGETRSLIGDRPGEAARGRELLEGREPLRRAPAASDAEGPLLDRVVEEALRELGYVE